MEPMPAMAPTVSTATVLSLHCCQWMFAVPVARLRCPLVVRALNDARALWFTSSVYHPSGFIFSTLDLEIATKAP